MRNKKGLGVIEAIIVTGIVAGIGMGYKYLTDVKNSGKQEAENEVHEANVDIRLKTDDQMKEFQEQQAEITVEERQLERSNASPREKSKKAMERWGK